MGELPENVKNMLEHYNKGIELYFSRQWEGALQEFQKALEFVPGDPPSKLYVERCEGYIKEPPPGDWDGVYVAKTK
ncbi:MAG: tetratricopeptide repeat protein [bacterium]